MIHQWKRSLLEGAAGIFEFGGKSAAAAEIAEETVRDLHAKIGELAVGRWISFHNHQRPHTAHGGQPPAVVFFNETKTDQQVQAVA